MSFVRPTLSELIERTRADIESRLPGADSRLRHSALDVLARAHAGAVAGLYGYLDFIARQIPFDTAEGEILARWASIWGIQRKAAQPASGSVVFTGTNGVTIPAATDLVRIDGALYRTMAAVTIAAGEAVAAVESVDAGEGTAVEADAALTLASAIAGVNAIALVDEGGIAGGAAEESDADLLARFLQRVRKPPEGGSASDYVQWALLMPEVTRAWVYPSWMGAGTVGVTFALDGREEILPLEGDLEAMEALLDGLKPVTAELVVFAATPRPIDMTVRLAPNDAGTQAAVLAELADMFTRDAVPGGTIYLSRIREAISLASGELYHDLDLPSMNVTAGPGEMPTLGTVTFL
ncbi:MAG: baseplate J/gp47 family protein [Blastomonas sp.]